MNAESDGPRADASLPDRVEAAAKAAFEYDITHGNGPDELVWQHNPDAVRYRYRSRARSVLAAADACEAERAPNRVLVVFNVLDAMRALNDDVNPTVVAEQIVAALGEAERNPNATDDEMVSVVARALVEFGYGTRQKNDAADVARYLAERGLVWRPVSSEDAHREAAE